MRAVDEPQPRQPRLRATQAYEYRNSAPAPMLDVDMPTMDLSRLAFGNGGAPGDDIRPEHRGYLFEEVRVANQIVQCRHMGMHALEPGSAR